MNRNRQFARIALTMSGCLLVAAVGAQAQAVTYTLSDSLIVRGPTPHGVDIGSHQGTSIAISNDGNTVLSGAPRWGRRIVPGAHSTLNPGAGLIWTSSNGSWTHTVLPRTGATENAQVGSAVALDALGRTALLGAPQDSAGRGSVLVMVRDSAGSWSRQARLTPTPRPRSGTCLNISCRFGTSVALSGDGNTAVVGAPFTNWNPSANTPSGGVWVFRRSGTTWSQDTALVASDEMGHAMQGWSVGLNDDGTLMIFGGIGDNKSRGAAWIYRRQNGAWSEKARLTGDTTAAELGYSVALSGDGMMAVVGAPAAGTDTGAVWRYSTGDYWQSPPTSLRRVATPTHPFPYGVWQPGQGVSVSIANQAANYVFVVGGVNSDTLKTGAAWVLTSGADSVSQLTPGGTPTTPQGRRVAISADGSTILSADGERGDGVLYVYRKQP